MQERPFVFGLIPFLFSAAFSLSAVSPSCTQNKANSVKNTPTGFVLPYQLDAPDQRFPLLHPDLQEISGLSTMSDPNSLCAISDEKGQFFVLALNDNCNITQKISFRDKGDFEGIEAVGDTIYCIKSDGDLFQLTNWKNNPTPSVQEFKLDLKDHDIEGLCYDAPRRRLLLAGKEDPETNSGRPIWAFDLNTKTRSPRPVLTIDPKQVDGFVDNNDDSGKVRYFSTSGIAVHPTTGDIYAVSTALKRLCVLDAATGVVKAAVRIDKNVLGQPEGITFTPDGTLYISSEAKKSEAAILRFKMKKT
jgi:uncharacterized protein YjiK